jgi:hypothetical protein
MTPHADGVRSMRQVPLSCRVHYLDSDAMTSVVHAQLASGRICTRDLSYFLP